MANHHAATYLNDHLAGSVVAIELLATLERTNAGTDLSQFAAKLKADITEDRQVLEALMKQLHIGVSKSRKAMAWVAEKLTELKLRLDDPSGGPLRLLEACEGLEIGIVGKAALWRALAAVAPAAPVLQGINFDRLEARAEDQRRRVEAVRIEAAKDALGESLAIVSKQSAGSGSHF